MHRRQIATYAATAVLFAIGPSAFAGQEDVDRALGWIPENAISFVVVPNVKAASDDLAALVEATGQGGFLAMGRPVDVLKAQFGIGANLDEKAPLVAYFPPAPAPVAATDPAAAPAPAPAMPRPVIVLGVTDADAFLSANLTAAPEKGDGAFTTSSGLVVFARKLDGRVALAPTAESLPAAGVRGIGERFRARLKADESVWLARADLVAWGSRAALHAAAESGRAIRIPDDAAAGNPGVSGVPGGFAGSREQQEAVRAKGLEVLDMLADGVVVVDIDPLGLFIGSVGVAEPTSRLAAVTAGGSGAPAKFDRLPKNEFYLALSADLDGLGGAAKFGELLDFVSVPRTVVPAWVFSEGADLRSVQLAAYPSKLGVAVGGALNDSALFIGSRNPARTVERIKQSVESFAGESMGVRREPSWTAEKKLKSGDTAIAFELKETVVDAAKRPGVDIERVVKQFIFGSRGLNGLIRSSSDGVVVTFSQRPDVFARAIEASQGSKALASDATVQSIEEWLPAQRDLELMVGVGQLVTLGRQIASSFVSEEQLKQTLPEVDKGAEPVAVSVDVGEGRVRGVVVVPAAVIKMGAGLGARGARGAGAAPAAPPAPPAAGGAKP
jgi:hypothetical protein